MGSNNSSLIMGSLGTDDAPKWAPLTSFAASVLSALALKQRGTGGQSHLLAALICLNSEHQPS